MNSKQLIIVVVLAFFFMIFVISLALADTPVGTAFSYQGRLAQNGVPVTGSYDMRFTLYNAATGGSIVGSTLTKTSIAVTGGLFTVTLDFGASAFNGNARWLEIETRHSGGSSYTMLAPRQLLSPTPYAVYSKTVPWGGISGIPSGFSDGTDNDTKYSAGTGLGLSGTVFSVKYGGSGIAATSSRSDHDHWGVSLVGKETGLDLMTSGSVYSNPVTIVARNKMPQGNALLGVVTESGSYGFMQKPTGVAGRNLSSLEGGYGVYGSSSAANSYGVYGIANGVGSNGVYGSSSGNSATGVSGKSEGSSGIGVLATAAGTGGIGVSATGKTYGMKSSADNYGVYSTATGSNGVGVCGTANSGSAAWGIWGVSTEGYAGYFSGKVRVVGSLAKSSGSFLIDHPLDPARKYLSHSFVESPDMMNIYNGNAILDANGEAIVGLPEWFEALNKDFRYQLTCIGGYAPVYVAEEISKNRFKIGGGRPGLKVSWQVTGVRQDAWADKNRIQVETDKPAGEQGTYLYPEGFGQKAELGLDEARARSMNLPKPGTD